MRNAIRYYLKSRKVLLTFLMIAGIALALSPYLGQSSFESALDGSYVALSIFAMFLCFTLPPYFLSFVQKRKSADVYLSLPIKRSELLNATLIAMMICVAVGILPGMLINALASVVAQSRMLLVLSMIVFLALIVVALLIINSLLFLIANNVFDGVVMMLAYTVAPALLYTVLLAFMNIYVAGFEMGGETLRFLGYTSIPYMWYRGSDNILSNYYPSLKYVIALSIIIVAGHFLVQFCFVNRKGERSERISDEWYAYPLVISFYVFLHLALLTFTTIWGKWSGLSETILLYILLFILYVLANFAYRRHISFHIKDLDFFAIAIAVVTTISFVGLKTNGFGLSHVYDRSPKNVIYRYWADAPEELIVKLKEEGDLDIEIDPDYGHYGDVSFNLVILEKDMSKDQEAIEIMESLRTEMIEEYYENRGDYSDDSANVTLRINDGFDEEYYNKWSSTKDGHSYSYSVFGNSLTYDQLLKISKYAIVDGYVATCRFVLYPTGPVFFPNY